MRDLVDRWPSREVLTRLVREAQHHGPRAIDALLDAIRPPLVAGYARRIPPDLAEDCAQVALIRLVSALPRIDPERADRYIARLVHNALRTAQRRHAIDARRSIPLEIAWDAAGDEHDESLAASLEERVRALRHATMSVLPSPLRELVLDLLQGATTAEIAARQHVSPITVRTRLHRARALLQEVLRDDHLPRAPRAPYARPLLRHYGAHPPAVLPTARNESEPATRPHTPPPGGAQSIDVGC